MWTGIPETLLPVVGLAPAADAAGRSGQSVSLKGANKAWIVYNIDQGNAATIALAPNQCTNVAGAGAKAIPAVQIYTNEDAATSGVMTKQATRAASFTTSAATKKKIVIFEIDVAELDTANSFDCIQPVTGASNALNITSAMVYLEGRYQPDTLDPLAN